MPGREFAAALWNCCANAEIVRWGDIIHANRIEATQ
jgi:hypothetical protein